MENSMPSHPQHITLQQLQQRIKGTIEQALPLPVWVAAEISELKVNYSGHCYLELVEKSDQPSARSNAAIPKAQARAVIWRSQYQMISAYFRATTGRTLEAGMKILAKVTVNYHELYGLSLQISDIDPAYTMGEVEREKQLTIEQLKADGVWDMNREQTLPLLVQRVAVVSSASAAGYRDFMQELKASAYSFRTTLFEAVMQGQAAEDSLCEALEQVAERMEEFDVVVIIRGGGSVSDLSCFNSYRLCSYVAQFPLPVITGIGHDKDTSVADMVAHTPLKTPTAVAAWLVEGLATIEAWLNDALASVTTAATAALQREHLRLERIKVDMVQLAQGSIIQRRMRLEMLQGQLHSEALHLVERKRAAITAAEAVVEAHNPKALLRKGFAIVRSQGKVITSAEAVAGMMISIELHDGELKAEVK